MLELALAEMPLQRRAIFTAALIDDLPYRTIAARFGVSVRQVEREVRRALDHAEARLEAGSEAPLGRRNVHRKGARKMIREGDR